MTWIEPNLEYISANGRACIICGVRTRQWCAPAGVLSGRFPCCARHSDLEVKEYWLDFLTDRLARQMEIPDLD